MKNRTKFSDVSRQHYTKVRYLNEHPELPECSYDYKNVGWSLGNDCPLNCRQCYSRSAREKGANLTKEIINTIINQLAELGVQTINLGGNEPFYTNGLDAKVSLLPYIIDKIIEKRMKVGITTSGITLIMLERFHPGYVEKINDIDISLDSPISEEHDKNRGQKGIYKLAIKGIEIAEKYNVPRTVIMCAMNWNFNKDRIIKLIDLAEKHEANVRFNPMKPIESSHMELILTPEQFYQGLSTVLRYCDLIDLSDPSWAASVGVSSKTVSGCPCGVSSFRIHSITPSGSISVSPCVYLHDYKFGDILKQPIREILESVPFRVFRRRKANPQVIKGCYGCDHIKTCGGGCTSRTYLHGLHKDGDGKRTIFSKDPYCIKRIDLAKFDLPKELIVIESEHQLVHQGYLCTGIFVPKK